MGGNNFTVLCQVLADKGFFEDPNPGNPIPAATSAEMAVRAHFVTWCHAPQMTR
jgi:hypothetical protein